MIWFAPVVLEIHAFIIIQFTILMSFSRNSMHMHENVHFLLFITFKLTSHHAIYVHAVFGRFFFFVSGLFKYYFSESEVDRLKEYVFSLFLACTKQIYEHDKWLSTGRKSYACRQRPQ